MPSIPKRVSDRLSRQTRKFQRVLKTAKDRDVNEADTVVIVTDVLSEVFGFDKYTEITSEYAIRSTFCDLAVKVEGDVKYLIEVKAIGLDLRESHLRQAVGYGAQHGIQWVVLTNGVNWEIYRIKVEKRVDHSLLTKFNVLDMSPRKKKDQEILFLLCKEGLTKAVMQEFDKHKEIVNKFVISAILQSEANLNLVKRGLKRVEPGIKVDTDEIQSIMLSGVLKRDVLDGKSAENGRARVKRAAGLTKKKRKLKPKAEPKGTAPAKDVGATDSTRPQKTETVDPTDPL